MGAHIVTKQEFDQIRDMLSKDTRVGSKINRVARKAKRSPETIRIINHYQTYSGYKRRNRSGGESIAAKVETKDTTAQYAVKRIIELQSEVDGLRMKFDRHHRVLFVICLWVTVVTLAIIIYV